MREADALLEQLRDVNQQLLSLNVPNPDTLAEAIERRSRLVTRVGHLLRDAGSFPSPGAKPLAALTSGTYRAALDQALEAGEFAVQRILSLSAVH